MKKDVIERVNGNEPTAKLESSPKKRQSTLQVQYKLMKRINFIVL